MSCRRGLTLMEALFAGAVFLVILTMVAATVVHAMRVRDQILKSGEARHRASIILGQIRTDLLTTRAQTNPDPVAGTGGWWSPTLASPWTIHRNIPNNTERVDYWIEGSQVKRQDSQGSRVLAGEVESFEINQGGFPDTRIVEVRIKMRRLPRPQATIGRAVAL